MNRKRLIMNRKQLITMWCAIAAIVFGGLVCLQRSPRDYGGFSLWVFLVVLAEFGLIYTFRNKKGKKAKE